MGDHMITIEKDVPITKRRGRSAKYPFNKMEVGDSFAIEKPKTTLLNAAQQWARRHNKEAKFTIRHNEGITRIWRIK